MTRRQRAKSCEQRAEFPWHLWSLAVDGPFPQQCCRKLLGAFTGETEPVSQADRLLMEAHPASLTWRPRETWGEATTPSPSKGS